MTTDRSTNVFFLINRDKSLSLSQNYARLGLTAKLNAPTGGVEKKPQNETGQPAARPDPLAIIPTSARQVAQKPQTAQVERDPETGKILRLIQAEEQAETSEEDSSAIATSIRKTRKPLEDPLTSSRKPFTKSQPTSATGIIPALEAEASHEASLIANRKRPRTQSEREQAWLARLIEHRGDDVRAMFRDRNLNPMQNTEADIKRRLTKFRKNVGTEDTGTVLGHG